MNPHTQNPGQDRKTSMAKYSHATQPNKINDLHKPHKSHPAHKSHLTPPHSNHGPSSSRRGGPMNDYRNSAAIAVRANDYSPLPAAQDVALDVLDEYVVVLRFEQHKEPGYGG